MIERNYGLPPSEALPTSPDKTDKKEKSPKKAESKAETPLKSVDKLSAEARLADKIDALSLFERPKSGEEKAESAAEDAGETAAPLETLSEEESSYVEQAVARERLAELAEDDTYDEADPQVDFLQRVSEGQAVEEAFSEVAEEYGIDLEALEADDESLDEPVEELEAPSEMVEQASDEAADDFTDEPVSLRVPTPPNPPTPPTGRGSGGAGSGGGGGGQPAAAFNAGSGMPPSAANVIAGPNQMPEATRDGTRLGDMLLGGLIGYLIGRRRGRIKTEKRLLPVQKKLEGQVKELSKNIAKKERQLSRLSVKPNQPRSAEAPTVRAERLQASRVETRLNIQKPDRAEQLGHMIVRAEAPKTVERAGNIRAAFRAEEVQTMNRSQLLELSEKIVVEGASLRHIYESNLVGERQLRHLVSEYLQGHDIRDELRKHMVEHEIDFERDPIMRDRVRSQLSGGTGSGGLGKLLADAGLVADDVDTALQHRVEREKARREAEKQRSHKQRQTTDVAMATAIVVLAVAVIILVWRG